MPAAASSAGVELPVGRRRRVDDDRVDAAQRRRPLRDPQRVARTRPPPAPHRRAPQRASPRRTPGGGAATAWSGCDGSIGYRTRATPGAVSRNAARRGRGGGVALHPQRQRGDAAQDEERARTAPACRPCRRGAPGRRRSAAALPATTPASTSEWPERYFVADSTTRSAPSASGRHRYGEANVLSTTTVAPWRWPSLGEGRRGPARRASGSRSSRGRGSRAGAAARAAVHGGEICDIDEGRLHAERGPARDVNRERVVPYSVPRRDDPVAGGDQRRRPPGGWPPSRSRPRTRPRRRGAPRRQRPGRRPSGCPAARRRSPRPSPVVTAPSSSASAEENVADW